MFDEYDHGSCLKIDLPLPVCYFFSVVVQVNGEKRELPEGLSLTALLDEMGVRPGRVVVELNRDVVSRSAHENTYLKEGDAVEIVHFVGGG